MTHELGERVYAVEAGQRKLFAELRELKRSLDSFYAAAAADELGKVTEEVVQQVIGEEFLDSFHAAAAADADEAPIGLVASRGGRPLGKVTEEVVQRVRQTIASAKK